MYERAPNSNQKLAKAKDAMEVIEYIFVKDDVEPI